MLSQGYKCRILWVLWLVANALHLWSGFNSVSTLDSILCGTKFHKNKTTHFFFSTGIKFTLVNYAWVSCFPVIDRKLKTRGIRGQARNNLLGDSDCWGVVSTHRAWVADTRTARVDGSHWKWETSTGSPQGPPLKTRLVFTFYPKMCNRKVSEVPNSPANNLMTYHDKAQYPLKNNTKFSIW